MFAVLMVAVGAKSSSLLKVPDLQKQAKPLNKKTIHYETMLGVPCRSHGAQRRAFSCFFKDFFFKNRHHGTSWLAGLTGRWRPSKTDVYAPPKTEKV